MDPEKKKQLDELRATRSQVIGELRNQLGRLRLTDDVKTFLTALVSLQESQDLLDGWKRYEEEQKMRDESNRDYTKPYNTLRPRSTASSGGELDEICGEIEQGEAGKGLDRGVQMIDSQPSRPEAYQAAAQRNTPPPMLTSEGSAEAAKLGKGLSSWEDTVIAGEPDNPMQRSLDPIFRRR